MKYSVLSLRTLVCTVLLVTGSQIAWSQGLGIGTTNPDASAVVEMQAIHQGALLPRVSLQTLTDASTVPMPATSLLVYNTNTGLTGGTGFYYNAGTSGSPAWTRLNTGAAGAGDNLGDHNANQTLRLNSNAITGTTSITGTGADLGTAVGIGVRADGGLNIGQNTNENIFLGYLSGANVTTGSHNQFSGPSSGYHTTTGSYNHFSGWQSGFLNTADENQFVGYESGYFNSSGTGNYFSGFTSGKNNHTGNYNHFSGYQSGLNNLDGNGNYFSGYQSGLSNTHGYDNHFSGFKSGLHNTTGNGNVFLGQASGTSNTIGNNNLFIGYRSGANASTVSNNQFIGYQSGTTNTSGTLNHFSGYESGYKNLSGSNNQFTGFRSGYNNTVGTSNQFSGYLSGFSNRDGSDNLFVGFESGQNNVSGNHNQFFGQSSGLTNTGSDNQFSGYQSGTSTLGGSRNQFTGNRSGYSNADGHDNQFDGYQSGYNSTSGNYNQFNGYQSGYNNDNGNGNLFVGYQSGYGNIGGGGNTFIGSNSALSNTSGNNNLFVGVFSGDNNTTGNDNWSFGNQSGPSTGALNNAGAVGYFARVSQSNSLVLGGTGAYAVKVGIGTTAPRGLLDVGGPGDTYLVSNPADGQGQTLYLPGHLFLAPYTGSMATPTAYIQARVPNPNISTNIGLTLRTTENGGLVDAIRIQANGTAIFAKGIIAPAFTPSDLRLKQNIRPLGSSALAAVQQLRGVRYQYRQDIPERNLPTGEQVGVIAQEVEKLYPELVITNADGYKAVNYAQLTPILLEAIKEQQQQLEALKTRATTAIQRADHAEATTASFGQRLQALEAATGTSAAHAQARR